MYKSNKKIDFTLPLEPGMAMVIKNRYLTAATVNDVIFVEASNGATFYNSSEQLTACTIIVNIDTFSRIRFVNGNSPKMRLINGDGEAVEVQAMSNSPTIYPNNYFLYGDSAKFLTFGEMSDSGTMRNLGALYLDNVQPIY